MNTLKKYAKRYLIDAMGSMALGLFASLLIGTIFKALGMIPKLEFLAEIGGFASAMAGPAMAVAIAYSLKSDPLVMFSAATVGYAAHALGQAGGPLAVLVIAIVAVEIGSLVSKKTKIDIIVTPFTTIHLSHYSHYLLVLVVVLTEYDITALLYHPRVKEYSQQIQHHLLHVSNPYP